MFELIVNWVTDSGETSMQAPIREWASSNGENRDRVIKAKQVGCSTHHCGAVCTVSPTFIRRSDLDSVADSWRLALLYVYI